jgi:hypothetical protein
MKIERNSQQAGFSFSIPGLTDLVISRRGFLVGASMVSLFPTLGRASDAADRTFSYQESPLAFLFRFAGRGCDKPLDLVVSKAYWGDFTGSKKGDFAGPKKKRPKFSIQQFGRQGAIEQQSGTVILSIDDAVFAGRIVSAKLIFDLRGIDCRICLKIVNWPRAKATTTFGWVDFVDFVEPSGAGISTLGPFTETTLLKPYLGS